MSRTIDDIISSVDQSRSSWAIVGALWKHFELPPASAPADLVPITRDFERVYGLLDAEYRRTKNESVKAGIMGIYATMSADTNLRGKVFRKGIVSKLVPLASNPQCRTVALISLATIASNGDVQERVELAKACARPLLQVLKEQDVDSFATYLCLMALTNACMGPLDGHALAMYPRLLASLPIPEVVRALTEGLHRLTGAPDLVRTAAAFFSLGVPQLELTPSANNFLIAGLRSADLKLKGRCLSALICRYGEVWEPDYGTANHTKYAACLAGIQRAPQNLRSAIQAFGVDRCEFAVTLGSDSDFQTALQTAYADRDMYALGKAMAPLLLRYVTIPPWRDTSAHASTHADPRRRPPPEAPARNMQTQNHDCAARRGAPAPSRLRGVCVG
ncbi:hypothetical protein MKEN_01164200 [Mycena kentingensis (nom. inval.)]|nr:hypothetical protein MKEN_01164200 [Mycena kentingensis (nom. inval.)]